MADTINIQALADAYRNVIEKHECKTNFERIKAMDQTQFIAFLHNCNFNGYFPVIEGKRFFTNEELEEWLNAVC